MKFQPDESATYDIRLMKEEPKRPRRVYEVSKWDGHEQPESVYEVSVTKKRVTCTCPGYTKPERKKPCRHCIMVALWVLNGNKDPQ